jgi:hypothetical protein
MTKGLIAGSVNLTLAWSAGAALPSPGLLAGAGAVGFLGYGVSLVLFVLGLRHLGAARTGAYFSTAPFIGAILSLVLFGEPVTVPLVVAAVMMGVGLYLHLVERHEHEHLHEAMKHEHRHVHDDHHQHAHGPTDPRASRIPIRIATRRFSTPIRITRTCITGTSMRTERLRPGGSRSARMRHKATRRCGRRSRSIHALSTTTHLPTRVGVT